MHFLRSNWITSVLILVSALLIGCSSGPDDTPDTAEVRGVVKLDGEPLPDAKVVFQPESGRPSRATTNAQGEYVLQYTKDIKGAKIGTHQVRIKTGRNVSQGDGTTKEIPEKVPAKYNKKTTLEKEVEAQNAPMNFNLKTQ